MFSQLSKLSDGSNFSVFQFVLSEDGLPMTLIFLGGTFKVLSQQKLIIRFSIKGIIFFFLQCFFHSRSGVRNENKSEGDLFPIANTIPS